MDLLKVASAFVIFWIGLCIGFFFLYVALTARNFWLITESVRKKVQAVEKVVTAFKGKMATTASYVPPLIEGITKIIEIVADKKAAKDSKKSKRK